tara:strand:- start:173 stop:526 length:354 start_codon:yes stop_codon:yes gene_type:complete
VLKYGCKGIHVNYVQELHDRQMLLAKVREEREKEREKEREDTKHESSVFATFKNYNMKKNENLTTDKEILIKRNYNKFKYGGKLLDRDVKNEKKTLPSPCLDVSYTHFKESQKAKTY